MDYFIIIIIFFRFVSYPEVMKADKLSYSSPSMATRMIMKSEKQEEEENSASHRDNASNKQHQQNVEKMCSSSPQPMNLPSYYLNGMGMQSIARLGMILFYSHCTLFTV